MEMHKEWCRYCHRRTYDDKRGDCDRYGGPREKDADLINEEEIDHPYFVNGNPGRTDHPALQENESYYIDGGVTLGRSPIGYFNDDIWKGIQEPALFPTEEISINKKKTRLNLNAYDVISFILALAIALSITLFVAFVVFAIWS